MTLPAPFSSGIELAPFLTSSSPLRKSWDVITSSYADIITKVGEGISWKLYREPGSGLTIVAFEVMQDSSNLQVDLVPSNALREKKFLHFEFLCTKKAPDFFVNSTALSLFFVNYEKLDQLKSEIHSSTRLIVTGYGLGGSVASLFTISLLDNIGSAKNRPLCITYGSPLLGDKKLQQAISRSSNWNSCFLHIVSLRDPLPRFLITMHGSSAAAVSSQTCAYTPFGTHLLCSDTYSTCFENPDSVLELLIAIGSIHTENQGFQSVEYGNIVENLNHKVICKDFSTMVENMTHPDSILASSISLQLQALGLTPHLQQQKIDVNTLETKIKMQEQKSMFQRRVVFDPTKKLNDMKLYMAQLEWYKKETRNQRIGYYDSYKNMNSPWDYDVIQFHKMLTNYWEKMVEEVEMKPQKEGATFRTRWLYAGTNYRRMVEPLVIAKYYREGGKDYVTQKNRSKHFVQLEEWLKEGTKKATSDLSSTGRKNVEAILTFDSCFWARVEEALLSCKELKVVREKEETLKKLVKFEEYVYELLKNYAVSPEIFLAQSTYMRWWNEYKAINGISYNAAFANFMNDARKREQYALGVYDFP